MRHGRSPAPARWASDELRSTGVQIAFLLRRALADAGGLPGRVAPQRRLVRLVGEKEVTVREDGVDAVGEHGNIPL